MIQGSIPIQDSIKNNYELYNSDVEVLSYLSWIFECGWMCGIAPNIFNNLYYSCWLKKKLIP